MQYGVANAGAAMRTPSPVIVESRLKFMLYSLSVETSLEKAAKPAARRKDIGNSSQRNMARPDVMNPSTFETRVKVFASSLSITSSARRLFEV
jgi:hypothetical protein